MLQRLWLSELKEGTAKFKKRQKLNFASESISPLTILSNTVKQWVRGSPTCILSTPTLSLVFGSPKPQTRMATVRSDLPPRQRDGANFWPPEGCPIEAQLKIAASAFRTIAPAQVPPSDEWAITPCLSLNWGFPGGTSGRESTCQCRRLKRLKFNPWVGKIPKRRAWQPAAVFLPGKSQGERSLAGYSTWGRKELDMTEQLSKHTHSWIINKNHLSFLPPTPQVLGKQDMLYITSALQGLIIWRRIRITTTTTKIQCNMHALKKVVYI